MAEDREHVRDIGVRLRGPVVHAVQSTFSENWVEETGELFVGDDVFPSLENAGDVAVHVASVKPEGSAPAVKILHHLVVCVARKRICIQNPYFLPDAEAIEALGQAVERGVDVRVMVPSAEASDMPIVQHAAHRNFERAARLRRAHLRVPEVPAAPEGDDGGRRVVRHRLEQLRRPLVRDQRRDHARHARRGAGRDSSRRSSSATRATASSCSSTAGANRGVWHKLKDNALYLFNEQL